MRIRTLKPEFWMHEGLCKCSEFTRLLAIALLNWSDDEGYFMANPVLIRGQVFPFLDESKMIPRSLQELSCVGWIELGKDNQGRDVGRVLNFAKHQRVDKPKPSVIKGLSTFLDESWNDPGCIQDESKEEWKGMEGKGMEGNKEGNGKPPAAKKAHVDHPGFDEFWQTYPRKENKVKAKASWNKEKPCLEQVITALKWQKANWDDPQYIPMPTTYLNARRFEDEKPKPSQGGFNSRHDANPCTVL